MIIELRQHWEQTAAHLSLGENIADDLFAEIIRRHSEPHRKYHGLSHLKALFDVLVPVRNTIQEIERVELAIWFHDIIYKPLRSDNEAKSADLATKRLSKAGVESELMARVNRLIRATAKHQDGGFDIDDALFLDADFSILGAPAEIYDGYVLAIRKEYRFVPKAVFSSGRAEFLRNALEQDRIFHTDYFEHKYGRPARENMKRELTSIE